MIIDTSYKAVTFQEFIQDSKFYLQPLSLVWFAKNGKHKRAYLELYCGFDIETYTIPLNHHAYMYIWQFSIYGKENIIVYGRTWSEFCIFIKTLKEVLELSPSKRLIVAVANLSYEFSFIKRWFTWSKIFAKELRQPVYAFLDDCIEFRDVLMITGGSLKTLAKEYTITQKRSGDDLDYKKVRTYLTPIDGKALEYCLVDVAILAEYMSYLFDTYIKPEHFIPLTKTGLLRREVKKAMGKNYDIKREIYRCYPSDFSFYTLLMKWCFRGGYTHSNLRHTGHIIDGIRARDITSSYPYTMLCYDGFPVSPLKRENPIYFEDRLSSGDYCIIFDVIFTGLRAKTDHSIESKSKCVTISKNAIIDNGRIRCATCEVWITELDFFVYQMFYEWVSMNIINMWTSKKGCLPKYLLLPLAKAYEKKAKMKHDGLSDTTEYALYKSLVNSAYGMTVTRLVTHEVMLSQLDYTWYYDNSNFDYEEEKKKAFLLPQWGIYVCAYSRFRILSAIYDIGEDAIYSDTDSIKYIGEHEQYFETINKYTQKNVKKVCKKLDLPIEYFYDLGSFEKEYGGNEVKGKFLGAKRYIISDGKKDIVTIAGLPKKALNQYVDRINLQRDMFEYGERKNVYDYFENNMLMNVDVSLKNAVAYFDSPHEDIIDGVLCAELSSAGIYPIDFTMKLDTFYALLIAQQHERKEHYEDRIY